MKSRRGGTNTSSSALLCMCIGRLAYGTQGQLQLSLSSPGGKLLPLEATMAFTTALFYTRKHWFCSLSTCSFLGVFFCANISNLSHIVHRPPERLVGEISACTCVLAIRKVHIHNYSDLIIVLCIALNSYNNSSS